MDKRSFIKRVREWDSHAVNGALADDPKLATYVDQIGKTPLHHCAGVNLNESGLRTNNAVETAKALVAAGADLNAVRIIIDDGEEFKATPLWYAVAWGKNVALVRFFLEHGAFPDANAVRSAVWDQGSDIAELLLSFGANIDPVIHHETPLLQTIKAKRFKLLDWLVTNGANINFQDAQGYTALHYAVKRNHNLGQIEQLLHHGANPSLKARDGTTPLSIAFRLGKSKLASVLEKSEERKQCGAQSSE